MIDINVGETYYRVAKYQGNEPKIMRSAGAWIKIYEDLQPDEKPIHLTIEFKE